MYAGIDIGGTNVKLALVTARGRVTIRGAIPTLPAKGPDACFDRIHVALNSLRGYATIEAVGVGCAGLVDARKGVLRASPNLRAWEGAAIGRIATRILGTRTQLVNDATAAAWGEVCCGAARGAKDLVFVTLGTGVGGGVIAGGQVVRGAGDFAGEIGHMTVDPNGPRCRCGNRGCVEAYAGSWAMAKRVAALARESRSRYLSSRLDAGEKPDAAMIARAARGNDRHARRVLKEAGEALGVAVASLVNVLNPAAVVFGGGVSASFDLMAPHIRREVSRRAFDAPARQARIVRSRLGNDATAIGAAMMARDRWRRSK